MGTANGRNRRRAATAVGVWLSIGALLAACSGGTTTVTAGPAPARGRVLLVGTFDGHPGNEPSIQAAVDAARPGDWILVAPGDYHEQGDHAAPPTDPGTGAYGGVLITTSDLHLRGMNRSSVIVDGTKPGSPACSNQPGDQDDGVVGAGGTPIGRNGIVVYKANGVSIDNLTACNFLAGSGSSGNEIWWNGGDDSGTIGLAGYTGRYLTATSTFYSDEDTAAQYGIFSSNSQGPGHWDQIYASNFNDSGMYVGACLQQCDMTIQHAWMEYDALGYSGTNSGGALVIEHSQFDQNGDGVDTNTQIAGDPPAPQNGACPGGAISPITKTTSCWVFMHNLVHDNNNPNVPQAGEASNGPTGTGMTISGGNNDTVMDNTFTHNGAWGILFVPFPDGGTPSLGQSCTATGGQEEPGFGCVYDPTGDALLDNTFRNNGGFGNPTNGDYGQITLLVGKPQNCFAGNHAPDGSTPIDLETTQATCGPLTTAPNTGGDLLGQVLCDTGFGTCPAGASYPTFTGVVMHPLPPLPSMPNPCNGVPANPWCPHGKPA
jgi:hypothetical protein